MDILEFFDFSLGNLTVTLGSSVLAVWGWVKWIGEKKIEQKFSRELEDHKSELQKLRDFNSFDLGRRLADFNLYSSKKHEVYRIVFSSLKNAFEAIMTLKSHSNLPNTTFSSKTMIKQFYERIKVPKEILENLLNQWSDTDANKQKVTDHFIQCLYSFVYQEITTARDSFVSNSLYLSDDVEKMCFEIVSNMNQFVDIHKEIKYRDLEQGYRIQAEREMTNHLDKFLVMTDDIKELMRKEMKQGYYNDDSLD